MQQLKRAWSISRWAIVVFVVGVGAWLLLELLLHAPSLDDIAYGMSFSAWYGHWRAVLITSGIFIAFLFGFARPRRRGEGRNAGLYVAFVISLFTEMYGIPLTIYLLAPVLGLPEWAFGMNESHLWAFALGSLDIMPIQMAVYLVTVVSTIFIVTGVGLLAVGWATVHRERGGLVIGGIYRLLRHPQYLGLILVVLGFNIQWPTLPTLLMGPALIVMYVRLARREDEELTTRFGETFRAYAARTPRFLPWTGSERSLGQERAPAPKPPPGGLEDENEGLHAVNR